MSLEECVRLARAMTLENGAADLAHGGGKSVLFGDPAMLRERKERLDGSSSAPRMAGILLLVLHRQRRLDRSSEDRTMRLEEIMSSRVKTVAATTSADDAWNLMRTSEIRHLVVTEGTRVVGVVSARDLDGRGGEVKRRSRTVAELMVRPAITARPTTTVKQAANLLRGYGIGCLPVLDGGRLRGIVSVSDLLDVIGRGSEKPLRRVERRSLPHEKMVRRRSRRG